MAASRPGPSPLIAASSRRESTARSSTLVIPARVSTVTARGGGPSVRMLPAGKSCGDLVGMAEDPTEDGGGQAAPLTEDAVVMPPANQVEIRTSRWGGVHPAS